MNKFTVSNVNTNVGRTRAVRFKKDQVTALQVCSRNMGQRIILGISHPRQGNTGFAKHITYKTGAVKPSRGHSSKGIRYAQHTECGLQNVTGHHMVTVTIRRQLLVQQIAVRSIIHNTVNF